MTILVTAKDEAVVEIEAIPLAEQARESRSQDSSMLSTAYRHKKVACSSPRLIGITH